MSGPGNPPVLEVREVSKSFGGLAVLSGVSFSVHENEIVGLIGPNGAGKTTLFNVITGLLAADSGTIYFRGAPISDMPSYQRARLGISRTFQHPRPFAEISIVENVMVGAFQAHDDVRSAQATALEWIQRVGLQADPSGHVSSLTLLNRKILEIARAMAGDPILLLLDEVMAGLSGAELNEAIALLREIRSGTPGKHAGSAGHASPTSSGLGGIILIEHVMSAVMSLSDRVVCLANGSVIADGPPEEIANHPEVLKAYLGEAYVGVKKRGR